MPMAAAACAAVLLASVCAWQSAAPFAEDGQDPPRDAAPRGGGGLRLAELADPSAPCVRAMASEVISGRPGASPAGLAQAAADLVRSSIAYAPDIGGDRWQTPAETVSRGAGDCEDTSVLLASVLRALGEDCCLLVYDRHIAVGVLLDTDSGHKVSDGDRVWTYIETAGDSPLPVGTVPGELASARPGFAYIE